MSASNTTPDGVALSDTALRRALRLLAPFIHDPSFEIAKHNRLMEESERRLQAAAHSGVPQDELVASRILGSPRDFQRWEEEHATLMRRVVHERRQRAQKQSLLSASLALIHRKALFEYLRDEQIRGPDRERLVSWFHAGSDYTAAVIAEHGAYFRNAASYMCSRHVGRRVLHEEAFELPLRRYERAYMHYFRTFCEAALARAGGDEAARAHALLAPLKQQVNGLRKELLGHSASSGTWKRSGPAAAGGRAGE